MRRICLMVVLAVFGVAPTSDGQEDLTVNRVEAIVNGKAITRFDVLKHLKEQEIDLDRLPEDEKERTYRGALLAMGELILREQAAKKSGIQRDPEVLQNRKRREIERRGGRAGFETFLQSQGLSEDEFDTDFRRRQETAAWLGVVAGRGGAKLNRKLRPLIDATVSPKELRRFYDANLKTRFTLKDEASVRVIQVYFKKNRRGDKARKLQLLKGLKVKVKRTRADFAVLAAKQSEHISADKGGLIVGIQKGESDVLPEPVEKAVFADGVKEGDILGPIENVSSLWLVKVEKRERARVVPFEEAQPVIEAELRNRKMQKAVRLVLRELVRDAYISPPRFRKDLERSLELR